MAYYFTVEEKKGSYLPLDIKKSHNFVIASNFKGLGLSLQEIDLFTTSYYDEDDLRKGLIKEGILPINMATRALSTRIKRNGKYHKVIYDFLYQKDFEYLTNPNTIIKRINQKLYDGDFRFVLSLANAYLKFYDCSSTAAEVRNHATFSIKTGQCSHYFDELDENQDPLLTRMIKLLIYNYYQGPNGKVTYKDEIKYLNLHSIIAFVNNYDKKHQEEISMLPLLELSEQKEVETEQSPFMDASNVKVKRRKRKPIPGQMGISEILK